MSEQPKNGEHHEPRIDVSGSLGMAGHETEDLGWEDEPDDAPVIQHARDVQEAEHEDDLEDIALETGRTAMPQLPEEEER